METLGRAHNRILALRVLGERNDVLATGTSQVTTARSRARNLTSNLRQRQRGAGTGALTTVDDPDGKGQISGGQAAKVNVKDVQTLLPVILDFFWARRKCGTPSPVLASFVTSSTGHK